MAAKPGERGRRVAHERGIGQRQHALRHQAGRVFQLAQGHKQGVVGRIGRAAPVAAVPQHLFIRAHGQPVAHLRRHAIHHGKHGAVNQRPDQQRQQRSQQPFLENGGGPHQIHQRRLARAPHAMQAVRRQIARQQQAGVIKAGLRAGLHALAVRADGQHHDGQQRQQHAQRQRRHGPAAPMLARVLARQPRKAPGAEKCLLHGCVSSCGQCPWGGSPVSAPSSPMAASSACGARLSAL